MGRTPALGILGVSFVVSLFGGATTASAQTASGPLGKTAGAWAIEVNGGWSTVSNPAGGTATNPPAGGPIPTLAGLVPSRAVASWYFGDGAVLFNQFADATLGAVPRISPLQFAALGATRRPGASWGVRVSRHLTSRVSAEFAFARSATRVAIGSDTLANVEAARASFLTAFQTLFAGAPQLVVTSTTAVGDRQGSLQSLAGTANVFLLTRGRIRPYLAAGAGVLSSRGAPTIVLTGRYAFALGGPISETDTVTLRFAEPGRRTVGIVGGGAEVALGRRSGVRGDVRVAMGARTAATLLSATPSTIPGSPAQALTLFTNAATIQFSNSAAIRPSTLSAAPLSDFAVFNGSGSRHLTTVTVGFFVRF